MQTKNCYSSYCSQFYYHRCTILSSKLWQKHLWLH